MKTVEALLYHDQSPQQERKLISYSPKIFGQNRSHEKLIRKFPRIITIAIRIYTFGNRFIQSEISCQNESVSSQRVHVTVGASSQVNSSFLANQQQTADNDRKLSSIRFISLDKSMKKYVQEQQNKKTRAETRARKVLKKTNMPWALSTTQSFTKQGSVWKLEANDLQKSKTDGIKIQLDICCAE